MVNTYEGRLIYGQRVKARGKCGIIRSVGDKIHVKFDDGEFAFFEPNEIEPIVEDSRLKGAFATNPNIQLVPPEETGSDPLSQPIRRTGRGVGEEQKPLGFA